MAKSNYPSSFFFPVLPVVDIFDKIYDILPHTPPKFYPVVWTTYEIQTGSLKGLGFGLGLFYVSDRPITIKLNVILVCMSQTDPPQPSKPDAYENILFENYTEAEIDEIQS